MPDFQQSVDGSQYSEIQLLKQSVNTLIAEVRELRTDIRKDLQDHETRIRTLESEQSKMSARLNTYGILQTGYTTVAGIIAALFGRGQ